MKGRTVLAAKDFTKSPSLLMANVPYIQTKKSPAKRKKNYFLKLGELVNKKVLPKLQAGEYQVLPEIRKNEILSRIAQGVEDVSVSREGVSWGIPVPWDKNQTIYVWVEALINYYSATQFLGGKKKFWPPDLHLMAKDILWFHAVIWEALLIAAGIDLPKTVFAHGFFTIDGQKMSKSLGNVITPKQLVDRYGVDGTRYLLISAVSFGSDGDISLKDFDTKYNADLANGLGNLVSRVAKLCEKSDVDNLKRRGSVDKTIATLIESYKFDQALHEIWHKIKLIDQLLNSEKPWNIENPKELAAKIGPTAQNILDLSYQLSSFLPETAEKIENQFKGPKIKSGEPLFPRLV